ncbi:hypothetical protein Q9233_005232 [Columba guinea]|nr:hypothetical protein Q9233_005232 [Columba guinea]
MTPEKELANNLLDNTPCAVAGSDSLIVVCIQMVLGTSRFLKHFDLYTFERHEVPPLPPSRIEKHTCLELGVVLVAVPGSIVFLLYQLLLNVGFSFARSSQISTENDYISFFTFMKEELQYKEEISPRQHKTLLVNSRARIQFLTELTRLFQKCRTSGSVFITLKKYDGRTKPAPRKGHVESFEPADNKCLLRATDGKKKISTVVSSKEVNKFQMAYSNLLRANMDGLKKKDKKSKNKKSKATQ